MVRRIFVEKKEGFNIEAKEILNSKTEEDDDNGMD